jgi:hypothetical protein
MALLVTALAAVIALGFLSRRVAQRRVVNSRLIFSQAQSVAWAGLEDARVKLMKSRDFPPALTFGATNFSYSEELRNDAGAVVGTYLVDVDTAYTDKAVIRSTARLVGDEFPTVMLRGELDTEPERGNYDMSGGPVTEYRPFKWMRVEVNDVRASE